MTEVPAAVEPTCLATVTGFERNPRSYLRGVPNAAETYDPSALRLYFGCLRCFKETHVDSSQNINEVRINEIAKKAERFRAILGAGNCPLEPGRCVLSADIIQEALANLTPRVATPEGN